MARNSGPTARNLLSAHHVGAGKGDAPRHKFNAAWRANFDEIAWGIDADLAWKPVGRKLVKCYGALATIKFFES